MQYEFLKSRESNARTYASTFEAVFENGQGARLTDGQGREIIDCLSCAGALPLGHNNPEVRDALLEFVASGQVQQFLDFVTPAKYEFVRELYSQLPPEFSSKAKIQFCSPSGSDAVEAAFKLVRFATGRQNIIAFHGAYHGMTGGALGAMGNLLPKTMNITSSGIHFAPYPYRFRCPFGSDGSETDRLSINYLRTILSDPESGITKPAGIIVEVVQGEGGCIAASDEWLQSVRSITSELQIPLIIDEVQTGFGRTGSMFAFQRAGITPDVLVLSKALGGGYPLATILYDESLDLWPRGMHAGTFRGNQIAMIAGRATMSIIRRDSLDLRAEKVGELLRDGLIQISNKYPVLGDVRGRGLMIGVEIVKNGDGYLPSLHDGELARKIKSLAFKNGVLIEGGGRNGSVLRFLPPLTLTEAEIGQVLDRIEMSVSQALET